MPKQFRGSYTVTVTPFTEDGSAIDVAGAARASSTGSSRVGVPGIIVLGTTGEFLTVTDDERRSSSRRRSSTSTAASPCWSAR